MPTSRAVFLYRSEVLLTRVGCVQNMSWVFTSYDGYRAQVTMHTTVLYLQVEV
jgi:hypothetical protein